MQDIIWNKKLIEQALQIDSVADFAATGIAYDSRDVSQGDLFLAFKGAKTDGHKFLTQVSVKGAVAALVEKNSDAKIEQIIVEDVYEAVAKMASFKRHNVQSKYIGVTGSLGKTSVKEMLATALKAIGKTHFSLANNNNKLGLQINLCRMAEDSEFAVFEVGMDKAGELSELSAILQPEIAVINNVAGVHRENFATEEDIARAKSEIFNALSGAKIAILNIDNRYFDLCKTIALESGAQRIVTFGENEKADIRLLEYSDSTVRVQIAEREIRYKLSLTGKHQALNSLVVIACCMALNVDIQLAANQLQLMKPQIGRGKQRNAKISGKSVVIIDDAYNAHPLSVTAALDSLSFIKHKGRKIAVLADMLELGPSSKEMHEDLVDAIVKSKLDGVITIGELMCNLHKALPENLSIAHIANCNELEKTLEEQVIDDDLLLCKGSYGTGLHNIINQIFKK